MKTLQKVINLMNTNDTLTQEIKRLNSIIAQQENDLVQFREIQKILNIDTDINTPETKTEDLIIPSTETVIEVPKAPFNAILKEDNINVEPNYNAFSDEALQALDNEYEEVITPLEDPFTKIQTPFDNEPTNPFDEDTTIDDIFPPIEPQDTGVPKSLEEQIALLQEDEEEKTPIEFDKQKEETPQNEDNDKSTPIIKLDNQTKDYTTNPKDIFIGRLIPNINNADKKAQLINNVLNKELNPINENNLMIKAPQMQEIKKEYSKLSKFLNRATTNQLKSKLGISKTFTIDSIPARAVALECMKEITHILEFGELADSLHVVKKEEKPLVGLTPNEDPRIEDTKPKDEQKPESQMIHYILNTDEKTIGHEIYSLAKETLTYMFKARVENDLKAMFENQRNSNIKNKDMHNIYIEHGKNGDNTLQTRRGLNFFNNQIFDLMGFEGEVRKIVEDI